MKKNLRTLIAGLALILVTNAVALIGVYYNRSGEPDALMVLTERELVLPYRYGFWEENSGIVFDIRWRIGQAAHYGLTHYVPWGEVSWLDEAKLNELGYTFTEPLTSQDARRRYNKMLPREAYLVLEYDGDEHKKAIEERKDWLAKQEALLVNNPDKKEFKTRVKSAQDQLQAEEHFNSRLFVIDTGTDKQVLRAHYPDRSKYLIMTGQVDIQVDKKDDEYLLRGYIRGLNNVSVNVPLKHHPILKPFMDPKSHRERYQDPRYRVELAFGQRLEPWVRDVAVLK